MTTTVSALTEQLIRKFPQADADVIEERLHHAKNLHAEFQQLETDLGFQCLFELRNEVSQGVGECTDFRSALNNVFGYGSPKADTSTNSCKMIDHAAAFQLLSEVIEQKGSDYNLDTLRTRLELSQNLQLETDAILEELMINDKTDRNLKRPQTAAPSNEVENEQETQVDQSLVDYACDASCSIDFQYLSDSEVNSYLSLLSMFPDIDPVYLLQVMIAHAANVQATTEELVDRSYPKLVDRLHAEQANIRRQRLLNTANCNVEELLLIYDADPKTFFRDETGNTSELYRKHAIVVLNAIFAQNISAVRDVFRKHNHHFYGAYKELATELLPPDDALLSTDFETLSWPADIDETFFRELLFIRCERLVEDLKMQCARERQHHIEKAKDEGLLIECKCCADQECLETDRIFCDDFRHDFCKTCVKAHANTQIGDGKHFVPCIEAGCDSLYGIETLKHILRPNCVALLLRRISETKLRLENSENLETCPFCPFAAIVDNPDSKIFNCLNPTCLKESCRLCRKESHIPLRCGSADDTTKVRTFIENRMAEAMIRICPNKACGNRIIKETGCNEMTCACGQVMCYICRQSIKSSGHFASRRNPGGCPQFSNLVDLHQLAALKAGHEARSKFNLVSQKDIDYVDNLIDPASKGGIDDEVEIDEPGAAVMLHMLRILRNTLEEGGTETRWRASSSTSTSSSDSTSLELQEPGPSHRTVRRRPPTPGKLPTKKQERCLIL